MAVKRIIQCLINVSAQLVNVNINVVYTLKREVLRGLVLVLRTK